VPDGRGCRLHTLGANGAIRVPWLLLRPRLLLLLLLMVLLLLVVLLVVLVLVLLPHEIGWRVYEKDPLLSEYPQS